MVGKKSNAKFGISSKNGDISILLAINIIHPSIFYTRSIRRSGHGGAGAYPCCHWARVGVHPGQVVSPSQGAINIILNIFQYFSLIIVYSFYNCRRTRPQQRQHPSDTPRPRWMLSLLYHPNASCADIIIFGNHGLLYCADARDAKRCQSRQSQVCRQTRVCTPSRLVDF